MHKFSKCVVTELFTVIFQLFSYYLQMRYCFVIYILLLALIKLAVGEQRPRCLHYPAESVSSLQDFNESCKKFSESYIFFLHRITIHGRFRYQLFKHDLLLVQLMNLIKNSPELPHYFFEIRCSKNLHLGCVLQLNASKTCLQYFQKSFMRLKRFFLNFS